MNSYTLIIYLEKETNIKVGALGQIDFKEGFYTYTGSGDRSRIKRHKRISEKGEGSIWWHIDYLNSNPLTNINEIVSSETPECIVASKIGGNYIEGFGCSDCSCFSHLSYFSDCPIDNVKEAHLLEHSNI